MDLLSLSIFRSVAKEGGVTRAAEALGRAPSNVTTRMQQLEAEIGVMLFVRENRRMTLTREGETFLDYSCRILELAEEAQQVVNPAGPMGTLRIGSMESTVATRLSPSLAAFSQAWPRVTIDLSTAPTRQLLEALKSYNLDCAFVAIPDDKWLIDPEEFETTPVFHEELMVLLPPGHPPLKNKQEIIPRSLAAFAPGCTYRKIAEEWISKARSNISGFQVQEVKSYHAMIACTAAGSCFSILPRSVLQLFPDSLGFTTLSLMTVETHLAVRSGFSTPAYREFRELVAQHKNL